MDLVVGIEAETGAETGWIEAETQIAVGGMIAVTVATDQIVAGAATTEGDDRTAVGVAAAGGITRLSSFSFHSLKS